MVLKIIRCKNEKSNKPGCPREYAEKEGAKKLPPCLCGGERSYSKKWYVRLQVNGKPFFRAVSTKKDEAIRYEAEIVEHRRVGMGSRVITKQYTVKEVFESIFETYIGNRVAENRISEGSAKAYRVSLTQHVVPILGHIKMQHLDLIAVSDFAAKRRGQRDNHGNLPKAATINAGMMALKILIKAAINARILDRDPLAGMEKIPENNTRDRVLSSEEIDALLKSCKAQDGHTFPRAHLEVIVLVALNTGLRREGVLGLCWEHINWASNEITRVVKHRRSRGEKRVTIPMSVTLRTTLLAWRNRGGVTRVSGLLFPSAIGGGVKSMTGTLGFSDAVKRAGLEPFVFHQLRHTFITHFIQAGNSLALAGDIVGHTSASMTSRYTHLQKDFKQRAMANFNIGGRTDDQSATN